MSPSDVIVTLALTLFLVCTPIVVLGLWLGHQQAHGLDEAEDE